MNWNNFETYSDGYQAAFETLCNHLFTRYLKRIHTTDLIKSRVINGAGGDGGIEAYGELKNGDIIGVQAKWFRNSLEDSQISQMKKSLITAMSIRPNIKEYFFCVPRNVNSVKIGKGKKPVLNYEEKKIDNFHDAMKTLFPDLKITWWFEDEIQQQLMEHENEGINKFYFEKEIISLKKLQSLFEYSKAGWLHERYIPELHGQGEIQNEIQKLVYSKIFRTELSNKLSKTVLIFKAALSLIHKLIPTLKTGDKLISDLEVIIDWLDFDLHQLGPVAKSIDEGVEKFDIPVFRKAKIERSILDQINAIKASNEQMSVKDKILDVLQALNNIDLHDLVQQIALDAHQNGRLFLGDAGTGKTHGLTNIVEVQLRSNSPAVIIRAQGTPCKSWKEILCNALEIDNWSKDQILAALENVALRNDHMMAATLNAGDDQGKEYTKVVICIDGLEEDSKHWREWYERMREASLLMVEFPRIKFVFSARTYFLNETSFPKDDKFKYIF